MSGPASWSTPFTAVPLYRLRILYADSAPATSYRIIETCDCGRRPTAPIIYEPCVDVW